METVTFKLPQEIVARLADVASDEDISLGQAIRRAVERDLRQRDTLASHPPASARLLAPIRARVQPIFLAAQSWGALKVALVEAGYSLREAGGGLALHDAISGQFLCRTSEIGFGYPALMRQLSGPFPGHSHTWLLDRIREVPIYVRQ